MTQPRSSLDGDDSETIGRINKQLGQAANHYSRQEDEDGNDDGGRFGVRVALHAAMELLEFCDASSSQIKPLNRLSAALDDLDHGKVADVLRPVKLSHRPRNTYERELLRAYAVAALDLFMAGGMSEKEASALVARRLRNHGYTITNNKSAEDASVVRGWRKNIDNNRAKDRRDNLLRELDGVQGTDEAKARKLLDQLPKIVPVKS